MTTRLLLSRTIDGRRETCQVLVPNCPMFDFDRENTRSEALLAAKANGFRVTGHIDGVE